MSFNIETKKDKTLKEMCQNCIRKTSVSEKAKKKA